MCVFKNTDQKDICASIVFIAESKKGSFMPILTKKILIFRPPGIFENENFDARVRVKYNFNFVTVDVKCKNYCNKIISMSVSAYAHWKINFNVSKITASSENVRGYDELLYYKVIVLL